MAATSDVRLEGQKEALKMMGLGDIDLGVPETKIAVEAEQEDELKATSETPEEPSFDSQKSLDNV